MKCRFCPDTRTEFRPEYGQHLCDRCYDNPLTTVGPSAIDSQGQRFSSPYEGDWRSTHPRLPQVHLP